MTDRPLASGEIPCRMTFFAICQLGSTDGVPMAEPISEQDLERFRPYLQLVVKMETDARFAGKIDASGIVQQSLWEASQQRHDGRLEDVQGLKGYLRRIVANNLADEIRKLDSKKRDVRRERSLQDSLEQSSHRLESWLSANQSSPSRQMMREEQMLLVASALLRLPDDQRVAIELHHLQSMSLADTADRMQRSKGSVASLIFRGLEGLRKSLTLAEGQ